MTPTIYRSLRDLCASGQTAALGIITSVKGSSPQKRGAKALFFADGRIVGTMGGGCLEAEIQERARRALLTGRPDPFDLVLDHDFGWDDGLICGGRVSGVILPNARAGAALWEALARRDATRTWGITADYELAWVETLVAQEPEGEAESAHWLYRETVTPPCALWIAGAGHIAQAVAPLAVSVDFEVTIFDDRASLASRSCFTEPVRLCSGSWEEIFAEPFPAGRPTFGLIVTRGHRHDALVLRHWIHRDFAFLGMIGSSRKSRTIREHFLAEGIAGEEALNAVSSPVGLDIGAVSVPEIAVSIMGQFIQKRAAYVAETNSLTTVRGAVSSRNRGSFAAAAVALGDNAGR
ncbi:MAG: XdhC family protein [Candidatus Methylacidiphilales bacterium]